MNDVTASAVVAVHNQAISDLETALDALDAIERALRDNGELFEGVASLIATQREVLISRASAHEVARFELTGTVR